MNELWLLLTLFFGFCLYYMLKNKLAIFFPSFSGMIKIIDGFADVEKDDVLYDLGSGDGRILRHFAEKGLKCVGIEHNFLLNRISKKKLEVYPNVKIIHGDIFDQDLSDATVVIAYLSRIVTKRLQRKIENECKKGTRIILVSYKFSDWNPIKVRKWLWIPIRLYVI
ncbi:MAG: methyltransferase domain-containing protein [Candidatus Aenigmarchaeota archaeon]|nr:methyltransferase domain-containing protein [Candidatus Aenigmarchaeota archaeon]